jgi:hypothetical protein
MGFFLRCGVLMNLKNEGVLLSGIGRGKELVSSRSYFLGEEKRVVFPFSPFFFPFSLYGDLTSMFSQENIF